MKVLSDYLQHKISYERAQKVYGVKIDKKQKIVNYKKTNKLRNLGLN